MTMKPGERQVAPTLEGIRADHVARYRFAARSIGKRRRVIDFACGVGYGARILADAGHTVHGFDRDDDALAYGREHYATRGAKFQRRDAGKPGKLPAADVAVCFETIEHLKDPRPLLHALRVAAPTLLASVPNEADYPYTGQAYHFRHYTLKQFEQILAECGWRVTAWHAQEGPESDVEPALTGRTLIAIARRAAPVVPAPQRSIEGPQRSPGHVAIVGLGPSCRQFLDIAKGMGGRHAYCDEVWAINALGDVLACDMVFHMDDVRVQEARAAAAPASNIAQMVKWLREHRGPIMTSRTHPDYPGLAAFPLEEVLNTVPEAYFNSTAAYAVAYAIYRGATRLSLFGMDFTYPNAHQAERGRACVEFWLGIAAARGIKITLPKTTSLMDACNAQAERFYGFDCVDLRIAHDGVRIAVEMTERGEVPNAEEVEERYSHQGHPNPLVKGRSA